MHVFLCKLYWRNITNLPDLWQIPYGDDVIRLVLDRNDMKTLKLFVNNQQIAVYNEDTEQFIGIINGSIIKTSWPSPKTLVFQLLGDFNGKQHQNNQAD
jgi:hypothetical protein